MSDREPQAPLLPALRDLVAWWATARVTGAVIGGVAASCLGRPRFTRDVDAVVWLGEERWQEFVNAGALVGIIPRVPDPVAFARESRVLLLRHEPTGIDIDLSLGALPFEQEAIGRAVMTDVGGIRFPLVAPEDLIIMKSVAHRPQDRIDIEAVLDAQPNLDLDRVRNWVREFALALDMPEIADDLEALLAARKKGGR